MSLAEKYVNVSCCECGMAIWLPSTYKQWLLSDARRSFFCPRGHKQHFTNSENDLGKLRRERDRLKQQQAQKDDEIRRQRDLREHAERSASAYKGQATRLRNRAKNGVCPCCNRTFVNLQRHMKTQHPEFQAEAAE